MRTPSPIRNGFTLVELLTVIAVIGILAAILIPTVGTVQNSARKTATRALFTSVIGGIELFRTEYGYLPDLNTSSGDYRNPTNGSLDDADRTRDFFVALTGSLPDGTAATPTQLRDVGNIRRSRFVSFTAEQTTGTGASLRLVDAFGNTDIRLIMDTTGAGQVPGDGFIDLSLLAPEARGFENPPRDPGAVKIRATAIMYSAGQGRSNSDIVKSWAQ
jgi:prepilin-type N-terminal cleavage/methylation domain-containing protein